MDCRSQGRQSTARGRVDAAKGHRHGDGAILGKPGCAGNARQKAILAASGHTVVAHNLLAQPWTTATLLPFLAGKPVAEWFNRSAARIKSGEIRPEAYSEVRALALLLADSLLIRRPLIRVDNQYASGFEAAQVAAWIGLAEGAEPVDETCQKRQGYACATQPAIGP